LDYLWVVYKIRDISKYIEERKRSKIKIYLLNHALTPEKYRVAINNLFNK